MNSIGMKAFPTSILNLFVLARRFYIWYLRWEFFRRPGADNRMVADAGWCSPGAGRWAVGPRTIFMGPCIILHLPVLTKQNYLPTGRVGARKLGHPLQE